MRVKRALINLFFTERIQMPLTSVMAVKRYPMMASHQVIIVKEAQNLTRERMGEIYSLRRISHFYYHSRFLLQSKTFDKRSKRIKRWPSIFFFESEKLRDYQVPG